MAESVGGDMLSDAGKADIFFEDALDGARSEAAEVAGGGGDLMIAGIIKKEGGEGVSAGGEIIADAGGGGGIDENGAILATFTTNDKLKAVEINRITIKRDEFGDTKTARKEQLDNGTITKTSFSVERNDLK